MRIESSHDHLWAAVSYASFNGNPGMVEAVHWIHMEWGTGLYSKAGSKS